MTEQEEMILHQFVFESLDNAQDNGAFESGDKFEGASAELIADDMVEYFAGCNDSEYTEEQLIPHIKAWLIIVRK
jgi:hypothetical protein